MNSETKNCQNCKQDFVIEPEDFQFYEKMKVPPPTWCPQCRMIRRFAFFNVWSLYKRNCSKCGKGMITIHAPEKEQIVYCQPCWWADDWDGKEYAMDYDSSRPFLEQVKELTQKTPWQALESAYLTNKNTDYANALGYCKDSYMIFWADFCENAYYSTFLNGLKDSSDCYRAKDSELCYEDVSIHKCYRTFFSEECDSCTDVWFSRNCTGCTDCFGCVNLRNKSYCIYNEQYTKEEYFEKLKEFNLESRAEIVATRQRMYEFWKKYPQRMYIGSSLNVNVSGDYIFNAKNVHNSYLVDGAENSRYIQFVSVPSAKDCYDYSGWGNGAELVYESIVVGDGASNVKFSFEAWPNAMNNEYCIYSIASRDVFGCVNLKRQQYCILNKQYTKEEYEKLIDQIKKDMDKNPYVDSLGRKWGYGEFFPLELSSYGYNETLAHQFFPKTKEAALAEGLKWFEGEIPQYTVTKKGVDLPDTITQTPDSILSEVIECAKCKRAYKIIQGELNLMRRLSLPLPSECSNCRQKARFDRTNPLMLYKRTCAKCNKEIQTSYAPDRSEIVYCEQCYQQEVA